MRNANTTAAVSRHEEVSPGVTAPHPAAHPAAAPANETRVPRAFLKGRASILREHAMPGILPAATRGEEPFIAGSGRSGHFASFGGTARRVVSQVVAAMNARAGARARRIADEKMRNISDHVLRDLGLARGAIDAEFVDAARYGPRI